MIAKAHHDLLPELSIVSALAQASGARRREDRSPKGQDECEAGGLVHKSRPNGHARES